MTSKQVTLTLETEPQWQHDQVDRVLRRFVRQSGEIQDRSWLLQSYPVSFTGNGFISWVVKEEYVDSRETGLALGNRLIREGLIHHVLDKYHFLDEGHFYRCIINETPKYRAAVAATQNASVRGLLLKGTAFKSKPRMFALVGSVLHQMDPYKKHNLAKGECQVLTTVDTIQEGDNVAQSGVAPSKLCLLITLADNTIIRLFSTSPSDFELWAIAIAATGALKVTSDDGRFARMHGPLTRCRRSGQWESFLYSLYTTAMCQHSPVKEWQLKGAKCHAGRATADVQFPLTITLADDRVVQLAASDLETQYRWARALHATGMVQVTARDEVARRLETAPVVATTCSSYVLKQQRQQQARRRSVLPGSVAAAGDGAGSETATGAGGGGGTGVKDKDRRALIDIAERVAADSQQRLSVESGSSSGFGEGGTNASPPTTNTVEQSSPPQAAPSSSSSSSTLYRAKSGYASSSDDGSSDNDDDGRLPPSYKGKGMPAEKSWFERLCSCGFGCSDGSSGIGTADDDDDVPVDKPKAKGKGRGDSNSNAGVHVEMQGSSTAV